MRRPLYTLLVLSLAVALPLSAVTVSDGPQLEAAIASATGGETILLEDGNYGVVHIEDRAFSDYVTIRAVNRLGPELENVEIDNSSHVRLEGIRATAGRESIWIGNGSHHVQILDCELYGRDQYDRSDPHYSQVSQLYGLHVNGAADILVEDCYGHDVKSSCFVFFGVDRLTVRGCNADWTASDGYKYGGVHDALVENNTGMQEVHAHPDAHKDFMQIQGESSDLVFRGNWALMKTTSFQGIFANVTCSDVLLEDNIIYTGHTRGISIGGTNIVARNNTVLAATDADGNYLVHKQVTIHGATATSDNIVATYYYNSGLHGSDHYLQYERSGEDFHYDDYFANAMAGPGLTLEDLRPVAGSPAESTGAWRRIAELLDEGDPDGDPSNRTIRMKAVDGWLWDLAPADSAVNEVGGDQVYDDLEASRDYVLSPVPDASI